MLVTDLSAKPALRKHLGELEPGNVEDCSREKVKLANLENDGKKAQ